jgi:hypothetical protein
MGPHQAFSGFPQTSKTMPKRVMSVLPYRGNDSDVALNLSEHRQRQTHQMNEEVNEGGEEVAC